jgi:PadR family transcriptional regulator PadR
VPDLEGQNLTKACNEALILGVLAEGPKHGYQIALEIEERSEGFFRFFHGTLYPILHKLEQEGLIRGSWSGKEGSRRRKRYALTARGRDALRVQSDAWSTFFRHWFAIMGEREP